MTSIAKLTKAQLTESLVASQAALAASQAQCAEMDAYMQALSATLADSEREVRRLAAIVEQRPAAPAVTAAKPAVAPTESRSNYAAQAALAKAEAMRTGKTVVAGAQPARARYAPTADATAARAAYAAKVTAAKAQAARTGCSVLVA